MKIISTGIVNGYFEDKFGGYGKKDTNGLPTNSIPFEIIDAPKETKSFAAILYDLDAFEVNGGFPWIHWTLANLKNTKVVEDSSRNNPDYIQGVNSSHSKLSSNLPISETANYAGMMPPNRDHIYTLKVYALDTDIDLENGFNMNELVRKMKGHILASEILEAKYRQYKK